MNRRKEEQPNTSWNSFKIHLRDVDKKDKTNQKRTSFGVELDQRQEEEGSNEMCQGAEKEGSGLLCRGEKAVLLASLLHLGTNLLIHKRRASSLMSIEHLDLTTTWAMVKRAFLWWMCALSDSPLTPLSRVVTEAPMSGVGASTCDQIVQHFLLHFGPDGVGKHKNTLCLGLGMEESSVGPASDAAAQPTKEVLCLGKACGLFPVSFRHDAMGMREETGKVVGDFVGCKCGKVLLSVVVRNKVR